MSSIDEDIREEFKKSRSFFRVARVLGVSMEKVKDVIGDTVFVTSKREERYGGEGRPQMRKYVVAKKNVSDPWNNDSGPVAEARAAYEAGTHTMCKGRDGDTEILYLIPQAVTTPRPGYFSLGVSL